MPGRAGGQAPVIAATATSLGFVGMAFTPDGLCRSTLFHSTQEAAEAELAACCGGQPGTHPRYEEASALLQAYAIGQPAAIEGFPVDLREGSRLQQQVWLALRDIPRGETRSYGWLARHVGLGPGAARAIGAAVGANPLPLWLPCHRVVGRGGSLVGFGGGLAMKRRLLEIEGSLTPALAFPQSS